MINELKIEYQNDQFIDVLLDDFLFFLGGQNGLKRKIIRSLKKYSVSHRLNELEARIYGENGVEIYYNGALLNNKKTKILILENNKSIIDELTYVKDSLLYDELLTFQHDMEIARQIECLNNTLIHLELLLNQKISEFSDSLSTDLGTFLLSDILKKNMTLNYQVHQQYFPLEMMDASELLDEYLILIRKRIAREESPIWLVIINPESFLSDNNISMFFEELKKIATETRQLKFFIFSNRALSVEYTIEDIGKTVLLMDDYQQMPEFYTFRKSIERYYPDKLTISDLALTHSFFRISHLLGQKKSDNYYLKPRDMILLKVISKLLEVDYPAETSADCLTLLEKNFLEN